MDEVDKIIIHSLRQIGCNIDSEVTNLANFTPELLVYTVTACLREIKPIAILPQFLPDGMAQRFAVASTLAEACANAGYRNDIGYQTFLYPNVIDIRKLFMFLIEMLPKERSDASESSVDATDNENFHESLENEIKKNITEALHSPWVPAFCKQRINRRCKHTNTHYKDFKPHLNLNIPNVLAETATQVKYLPPSIFQQMMTGDYDISSSLLHKFDTDLYQPQLQSSYDQYEFLKATIGQDHDVVTTAITHTSNKHNGAIEENQEEEEKTTVSSEKRKKTQLEQMNDEVNTLKKEYDYLNLQRTSHNIKIKELKSLQSSLDKKIEELQKLTKMHERSSLVLEDPTENIDKLKDIIEATKTKRQTLEQQWLAYRTPLEQRLQELEKERSKSVSKSALDLRELVVQLEKNLQEKTAQHAQLTNELKHPNRSVNATAAPRKEYTRRIMEFIGNIRKQRNDIYKVLDDTRDLQKQINTVTGQLQRQFNYTDDLLYKSAKHDSHSKKAYKLLAALHSACNELVELVTQTGNVTKEIRDLEESVDCERTKNVADSLEKISSDIKNVENVIKNIQSKIQGLENRITEG